MLIAALTKYTRLGASSRLRTLQYFPALAAAGIEVHSFPLFDDEYLLRANRGSKRPIDIVRNYRRRLTDIRKLGGYDALWLEYELFPWLPFLLEMKLLPRELPLVLDYDDAIFHRYDHNHLALIRQFLGNKIDRLMARAELVIAGNRYLADRAASAGARRVELLPTVIDLDRYSLVDRDEAPAAARIGWIGSPSTLPYLAMLEEVVSRLQVTRPVECIAVGAPTDAFGFTAQPWAEETEAAQLRSFTIGVMPLFDSTWERGKCGYKLIQYMGSGLPVVASPVGVNREIVREGVDGFLASTPGQWELALNRLLDDPELRRRMGQSGRARVEADYSLQIQAPRLAEILGSLAR